MSEDTRALAEAEGLRERLRQLEDTQRATLNILEDFDEEKAKLRLLQQALMNLLEDFDGERRASQMVQRATLNLLEDMNQERGRLDDAQRAIMNMLEDVEVKRAKSERARELLETANKALRERSEQLRALASELTLAEQRERQRLARILHDGLQQTLVAARFRLRVLEQAGDQAVRKEAEQVGELIAESLGASRALTAELSPPILYTRGLVAALQWLARWMYERQGLTVGLEAVGEVDPLAEDVTVLLFQATRELLFNIVKHAGVKAAHVQVAQLDGWVRITVEDYGGGFDPSHLRVEGGSSGGFGLFSIRERLDLLGGKLEMQSAPGRGSRFTLVAPLLPRPGKAEAAAQP